MSQERLVIGKLKNALATFTLLGLMGGLVAFIGYQLAGETGLFFALVLILGIVLFSPELAPGLVLRAHNARPLDYYEARELHEMNRELAARAGLPRPPVLHYIPSNSLNAFTVGGKNRPAVALTDGILRALGRRELRGVLAHEIGHVLNNDLRILGLASGLDRVANIMAMSGQIMLLLLLPLALMGVASVSLAFIALLLVSPLVSSLLQLALSRAREYEADRTAARLTGDPEGLASALLRIERRPRTVWDYFFPLNRRTDEASLFRTHPPAEKRAARLLALREDQEEAPRRERAEYVPRYPARLEPAYEYVFVPARRTVRF